MKFLFYTHSLVSDWNHGNAHFLRGVMRELQARGHETLALEPEGAWSRENLIADQGDGAVEQFTRDFPMLRSTTYDAGFDHEAALDACDVVIVHEWTEPALVARIGSARRSGGRFRLLFHDTHHRAVSAEDDISKLQLDNFDGVLAFGETLRERYREAGWGAQVFTWHEAADVALFTPLPEIEKQADLIWIGNWGDGERTAEIGTFLVGPARTLGLSGAVRGVRYPAGALAALAGTRLVYGGWIANAGVPAAFARHRVTMHIPRRPYVEQLPGIPTIRMFEALACGIPLISAPWNDAEGLFRENRDFLFARDGAEMTRHLRDVIQDRALAASLAAAGLETVRSRHTCAHRVDELVSILGKLGATAPGSEVGKMEAVG